ncbi:MAG: anaerobic sulfatase maturase [Chloroflexi bacterium]|nr:anaerobic sulfatase maturase [Chloroflexota bacterium]
MENGEVQELSVAQQRHARSFHLLAKPTGAICNLDCQYCFFLSKEELYPGSRFRMTDEVLETYIRQLVEAQAGPEVTVAWQGGEPTLMGLDFFRKAMAYEEAYRRPGTRIVNTIQTNGTLIDEEWCAFFREHDFLVGISIDGPREMNDAYRVDKGGKPTFDAVMRGLRALRDCGVAFNVLTTVHRANEDRPVEVYRFLRDEAGARFIQFIPIVERTDGPASGQAVSDATVGSEAWGRFLIAVFEEWVRRDVGTVFVQMFDAALASWVGAPPALCIFAETCGDALALEHNGDVYSCDHFVEPKHLLGNIREDSMIELVASEKQRAFGDAKRDALPAYCRACEVRFACHGECPKNRFVLTPDGEPGLNYLCAGYKAFFRHIDAPMRFMADELRRDGAPSNVMAEVARRDAALRRELSGASRNDACPCGSGRKFKRCHGA